MFTRATVWQVLRLCLVQFDLKPCIAPGLWENLPRTELQLSVTNLQRKSSERFTLLCTRVPKPVRFIPLLTKIQHSLRYKCWDFQMTCLPKSPTVLFFFFVFCNAPFLEYKLFLNSGIIIIIYEYKNNGSWIQSFSFSIVLPRCLVSSWRAKQVSLVWPRTPEETSRGQAEREPEGHLHRHLRHRVVETHVELLRDGF